MVLNVKEVKERWALLNKLFAGCLNGGSARPKARIPSADLLRPRLNPKVMRRSQGALSTVTPKCDGRSRANAPYKG